MPEEKSVTDVKAELESVLASELSSRAHLEVVAHHHAVEMDPAPQGADPATRCLRRHRLSALTLTLSMRIVANTASETTEIITLERGIDTRPASERGGAGQRVKAALSLAQTAAAFSCNRRLSDRRLTGPPYWAKENWVLKGWN
jgi:hypothetical protein